MVNVISRHTDMPLRLQKYAAPYALRSSDAAKNSNFISES